LFASLSLGPSDDEDDESQDVEPGSSKEVAPFVSLLKSADHHVATGVVDLAEVGKRKGKRRKRKEGSKPNKWADKCMYAELLEMTEDYDGQSPWLASDAGIAHGLPADLEGGFVAVAPVPVGKRCLVVTHQSCGLLGAVPNTTLRSRVLGKPLIPRFPSPLPPLTVLDCILDPNWRQNGILHVLDVLRWKSQDIGDCETPFRFWWRDTRLAELPRFPPPSASARSSSNLQHLSPMSEQPTHYRFPYPTRLIPVPYYTDTTLPSLSSRIIPLARSLRSVVVEIPTSSTPTFSFSIDSSMDIDNSAPPPSFPTMPVLTSTSIDVVPDGMLLYTAQASYEPGTSPLSSWIPITGYCEDRGSGTRSVDSDRPLDIFERLVKQCMERKQNMDIER